MNMNSEIFHRLWLHNGKCMTVYSYIYVLAAAICLYNGDTVAAMVALMLAEINRVDKESRILSIEQANAIIYEGDHPEEFPEDEDDKHDKS